MKIRTKIPKLPNSQIPATLGITIPNILNLSGLISYCPLGYPILFIDDNAKVFRFLFQTHRFLSR